MPIEQSMSAILLLVLRAVLALALYLFIGWALWLIWRELKMHSVLLASRQPPPLTLTIESEEAITPLRFTTPVITIGRDPASDYVLDDIAVSAQHARLSYRQGQWWLEDLHSTNGTFLNQQPVLEAIVVTSGDRLRCGQAILNILLGGSTNG